MSRTGSTTSTIRSVVDTLLTREAKSIPLLPKPQEYSYPDLQPLISSTTDARLQAALYLLNDDIDKCHNLAQARDGEAEFDLMHAILHRREGDFWNSRWWIDRLTSPMLMELYGGGTMREAKQNAKRFVNRVEEWSRDGQASKECLALQTIQQHELHTLVRNFSI